MNITKNKTTVTILLAIVVLVGGIAFFAYKNRSDREFNSENNRSMAGLTLNTDKGRYLANEQVYFQIISLKDDDSSDCEANLELTITAPNDETITFKTEDNSIVLSASCSQENSGSIPDYTAHFIAKMDGEYKVELRDLNREGFTGSSFIVGDSEIGISLARWGASKIDNNQDNRYPMKFTVKASSDFSGQLVEQVPEYLEIAWQGPAKIDKKEGVQTLTWDIDLKAGEEKEFTYEYVSGEIESKTIVLGTAKLISNGEVIYEESRPWTVIVRNN